MWPTLLTLLRSVCSALRSRRHLALENLALRQQLALLRQRSKHPQFGRVDRVFWVWLSQRWSGWRDALCLVRPETVIRWHRAAWTAQQIVEAFPEESAPRYLLRDRDAVYGEVFRRRVECLGIAEVLNRSTPVATRETGSGGGFLFPYHVCRPRGAFRGAACAAGNGASNGFRRMVFGQRLALAQRPRQGYGI